MAKYGRHAYCIWCKRTLLAKDAVNRDGKPHGLRFTRDHIVAKSHGGEKWFPCCLACNQVKANLTLAEWDAFRVLVPRWWELFPKRTARTYARYVK